MTCHKSREHISRSIDGDLSGEGEFAPRTPPRCVRRVPGSPRGPAEDRRWRGQARDPRAVRQSLAQHPIRPDSGEGGWGPWGIRRLAASGLRPGLACPSICRSRGRGPRALDHGDRRRPPARPRAGPAQPRGPRELHPGQARRGRGPYQQAIKSLSEAFAAEKGTLAPQVAELFDRNLSVIDASIQACRRAVLEEPDDLEGGTVAGRLYPEADPARFRPGPPERGPGRVGPDEETLNERRRITMMKQRNYRWPVTLAAVALVAVLVAAPALAEQKFEESSKRPCPYPRPARST